MRDILFSTISNLKSSRAAILLILILGYIGLFVALNAPGGGETETLLDMDKFLLLIIQAAASGLFFLFVPMIFLWFAVEHRANIFEKIDLKSAGWVVMIVFSNMVFMGFIVEWNMGIDLPDGSFERWAQNKEADLKHLTEHLISFDNPVQFFVALIAMAVIPAVGEELLFRGLLQNFLRRMFGNYHVAIWVSAFVFSAIHLQFYGFFPRMLLGALFGYLYVWSGRLSVAMLGHLLHNGLSLVFVYLVGLTGVVEQEKLEESAPWYVIVVFFMLGAMAVFRFYKLQEENV